MIILDVIVCLLAIVFGYKFNSRFSIFNRYDKKILTKLYLFHLIIGFAFFWYISNFGGDSTNYWFVTHTTGFTLDDILYTMQKGKGSATGYLLLLNYVPAKVLGLTFFTGSLLYSILGYLGFVFFYASIKENIPYLYKLRKNKLVGLPIFPTLLFLPNLHFWSSGVGKDTLLFLCIALFVYSVKKIKKRYLNILLVILLSIFIRPHITLFLLFSFGLALLFDANLKPYIKVFLSLVFLVGVVAMFSYVLSFIQLESVDAETIESYVSERAANLGQKRTESAIDTSSLPFPVKVFTFLYRPLFIDDGGILGLIASFENLFLLLFTLKVIFNKPIKAIRKRNFVINGLLIFFIMGSISFALILGNLGIMLRQKTPFIMCFIIFGYWVLVNKRLIKVFRK